MRQPQPFFRKQTRSWYVQIGKRQINLGKDKEAAWEKYHGLMAERHRLAALTTTVVNILEAYLAWCQTRRAEGTYRLAKTYLSSFARTLNRRLNICKLTPRHITKWMDANPGWGDTTRNDAISHVQRAVNWAVKQRLIDASPINDVEDKPPRRRREVVYTPDQWKKIMEVVKDQPFRDLLAFMWETGCRPKEARTVERHHVDLDYRMIVFPPSQNKTRIGERVIFLNDTATRICERLCREIADGPIFRNLRGNPWTKDAIKCRFARIRMKTGLKGLCAYGIRHSYATEGLKNGVDSLSLASLMGHRDVTMIARTYQHLARNPEFLRQQAKRAKGQDA